MASNSSSATQRPILGFNRKVLKHLVFPKIFFSGKKTNFIGKILAIGLIGFAPILAILTALVFDKSSNRGVDFGLFKTVLLLDFCYIVAFGALIIWRINKLLVARKSKSVGSNLHLRLTALFSFMAITPAVIVAIFAAIVISVGIESWFSSNVNSIVQNSMQTAQAYAKEHLQRIRGDALAMANDLNRAGSSADISGSQFEDIFRQQAYLREIPKAYILSRDMAIKVRGDISFLYKFTPPTEQQMEIAEAGDVLLIQDEDENEMRALLKLNNVYDSYLYVSRPVDGNILDLLATTKEKVEQYELMERNRDSILIHFGVLYIAFAVVIILAAIWLGIWFADRLAKPIVHLVNASTRLAGGDYDVRVKERDTKDEIASLSRAFNRMTVELKGQRDQLVKAHDAVNQRRVVTEAVLSGATAGIIGIDENGLIDLVNVSASELIERDLEQHVGTPVVDIIPEFSSLIKSAFTTKSVFIESEVDVVIEHNTRHFMVRLTAKNTDDNRTSGYVITFDDMTNLVEAQRMAAWGDVARRIAHEIKNPLTPIQLSAERMRSKFAKRLGDDRASFEQYTDMIVRQAGDIRRMVDEFSTFGRLPKPQKEWTDVSEVVRDCVILQREANMNISYGLKTESGGCKTYCDRGLISQAVTNLLQNARDAIETYTQKFNATGEAFEIDTHIYIREDVLYIEVQDNGIGFQETSRRKLLEPYVTTRSNGTGLGLAIVRKIIEEHNGSLNLLDRLDGNRGALAQICLPHTGCHNNNTITIN
jgi:two-component system, NtrC family, nitrogen regulation sensor histidine kinase NtrY